MNAWGKWLVLAILLLAAVQLQAVVLNPSFEEYKDVECTGHPDINTDFDISDGYKIPTDFNSIAVNRSQSRPGGQPTGSLNTEWEDAYTWSVEKYVPDPNLVRAAYMLNWKVDKIEPAAGDRFVILDSDGKSYGPNKVTLSQTIEVEVGDRIAGQYFFGTYDYDQWADYATISLIPHEKISLLLRWSKSVSATWATKALCMDGNGSATYSRKNRQENTNSNFKSRTFMTVYSARYWQSIT